MPEVKGKQIRRRCPASPLFFEPGNIQKSIISLEEEYP
jgi:hypothetical protein